MTRLSSLTRTFEPGPVSLRSYILYRVLSSSTTPLLIDTITRNVPSRLFTGGALPTSAQSRSVHIFQSRPHGSVFKFKLQASTLKDIIPLSKLIYFCYTSRSLFLNTLWPGFPHPSRVLTLGSLTCAGLLLCTSPGDRGTLTHRSPGLPSIGFPHRSVNALGQCSDSSKTCCKLGSGPSLYIILPEQCALYEAYPMAWVSSVLPSVKVLRTEGARNDIARTILHRDHGEPNNFMDFSRIRRNRAGQEPIVD